MEMDMRRLVLRAALQKLKEGEDSIPENIRLCHENMASIYEEVDDIRHLQRRHGSTDWTTTALDCINLTQLGNFVVSVHTHKKMRTITFTDSDTVLEFQFKSVPQSTTDRLNSTFKRISQFRDTKENGVVTEAFVKSIVLEKLGGIQTSPDELLLGGKPMALDEYRLSRVRRINRANRFFRSLLGRSSTILFKVSP